MPPKVKAKVSTAPIMSLSHPLTREALLIVASSSLSRLASERPSEYLAQPIPSLPFIERHNKAMVPGSGRGTQEDGERMSLVSAAEGQGGAWREEAEGM